VILLPRRLDRDLAAIAALALLGLLVAILPLPDPVRALLFLPLVLFVPGYAVAAALFPPGFVTRDERAALTIAFSVGVWALIGLVLQIFINLDRGVWLAMLVFVTFAGVVLAQMRREGLSGTAPVEGRALATINPLAVVAIVAAVAIAAVSIVVASGGQERELDRARFSGFWITPVRGTGDPAAEISVGVQNHQDQTTEYRLIVTTRGRTIDEWRLTLEDEETWSNQVPADEAEGPVLASLYRDGRLYRRVKVEFGVAA
jgi:uncharacterized membrane protein